MLLEELPLQFLIVHFEPVLGRGQLAQEFLHGHLFSLIFVDEFIIFIHKSLIFVPLGGVEFIQSEFHLLVDVGEFISKGVCFFFYLFPFNEDVIKFVFEFFVLGFNMRIGVFNVFGPGVDSEFVEGDVVVGEGPFQVSDFFNQFIPSGLQFVVDLLFFVGGLCFLSQVLGLLLDALPLGWNLPSIFIWFCLCNSFCHRLVFAW